MDLAQCHFPDGRPAGDPEDAGEEERLDLEEDVYVLEDGAA